MRYANEKIRRQDRLLEETNARMLLQSCEYGVLSMRDEDVGAYGIPLSFVWDGGSAIYIHCAPVGRKLRCIATYPTVSFCVVGKTNVLPDKFTTEYESVIATCNASTGLSDDEKMNALRLLLRKYSPSDQIVGQQYAEKSFHRTEIIRLDILDFSGKCKRVG